MADTKPEKMNMELKKPLPVGSAGRKSGGWWGVWSLIVTEGSLFGYLLFSYFYLGSQIREHWPPEGLPTLLVPGVNTVILLTSSLFVWLSERGIRHGTRRASLVWMALAILFGATFVGVQLNEWHKKTYGIATHLYGSLYFTITGFHMLHVVVGLVILLLLLAWNALGYFDARRYAAVKIGGLYWHFVDVVWLFVFSSLYLFPYIVGDTQ